MKQSSLILLLLLINPTSAFYTLQALDYILRCIEYEATVTSGTLSLILVDLAAQYPFDNILNAILQSPRLAHVVKYVINGTYHKELQNLPWHPSMLLIHPGNDVTHFMRPEILKDFNVILELFNPTAKALVFVNHSNIDCMTKVFHPIFNVGFVSLVFFDSITTRADLFNGVTYVVWPKAPLPMYLFTWLRRSMTGIQITYVDVNGKLPVNSEFVLWIKETARYLKTEAIEYRTYCDRLFGEALKKCLAKQEVQLFNVDISSQYMKMYPNPPRTFCSLVTGLPLIARFAIPRDRPVNDAELMMMPFDCSVWLVLVSTLVLAEVVKQLFPNVFKNDPTLLTVCGFERHNLHNAGKMEKITYLSMIILISFASNAFETKMLSMMVNRPAIQRIKTLSDLLDSDIKFYADLEVEPHLVNQSIFGKMFVQGEPNPLETTPGIGMILTPETAAVIDVLAYDYNRMQPWYVLLDVEYQTGYEMYLTSWRYLNLEIFRSMRSMFSVSGLFDHWKLMYKNEMRSFLYGKRERFHIDSKQELNFDDMLTAWVVLGIGFSIGFVTFIGESCWNFLKSRMTFRITAPVLNIKKIQSKFSITSKPQHKLSTKCMFS